MLALKIKFQRGISPMARTYNINLWNERAKSDINFSSVISPNDKIGLKTDYVNTIDKNCIGPEILKLASGSKILDFGCGAGRLSQWTLFKDHHYFGIDQSEEMIATSKKYFGINKYLRFDLYDGKTLPFEDNSFDCVIAIWVLQHIIDDDDLQNLMNEFARVLRKTGRLLLIEQIADTEKYEFLKNGDAYKKCRTIDRFINLCSGNLEFVRSKKTDGLVSHGLFYKSLAIFSFLHFSFLRDFIVAFIRLDEWYYSLFGRFKFFRTGWVDTFLLFSKTR